MADAAVTITPGTGVNVDSRTQADGDHRQVIVFGDADTATTAAVTTAGVAVAPVIPGTATRSNVTAVTSDTQLLPAGTRRGFRVWNDSTETLLLGLGTQTVTAASYTVKVAGGGFYFDEYTGMVRGMWTGAVGTARITEVFA